jgi:ankyrin repeat protein
MASDFEAWYDAIEKGDVKAVQLLLDKVSPHWHLIEQTNQRDSPLTTAARMGHIELVKTLIERGARVNCADNLTSPALFAAAVSGYGDIARILIEAGANVNMRNDLGETALCYAAMNGHTDVVRVLVESRANVDIGHNNNTFTPLLWAAQYGFVSIVEILLDASASINQVDLNNATALFTAAKEGNTELVRLLIGRGADLNIEMRYKNPISTSIGKTALSIASEKGQTEIVELLEKAGAKTAQQMDEERARRRAEVEQAKREKENRAQEIQQRRRVDGLCVLCGQEVKFFDRLRGRDKHVGCKLFSE